MALKERVGLIGAGRIGSAILRGMLRAALLERPQLIASLPRPESREALERELGIRVTGDNREVCDFADIVMLTVKPQTIAPVLDEVAPRLTAEKLVVSFAAGVPTRRIESHLAQGARVVRVMTNTPCVVGAAASAYAAGSRARPDDLERVAKILESFGTALRLEERHLDAVTGLSGSGPAYVFLFLESLADGGVQVGLTRETALRLAAQTLYGAAKMVLETGKHPSQLKDEVTSPGGTTIAGLYALEKGGFRGTVMDAVLQATRRSQELGAP
jgi:pyrroline-5-carboxylate reductase